MAITMEMAKAIVRREGIGRVVSDEEVTVFLKGLTNDQFSELLEYTVACCEAFDALDRLDRKEVV